MQKFEWKFSLQKEMYIVLWLNLLFQVYILHLFIYSIKYGTSWKNIFRLKLKIIKIKTIKAKDIVSQAWKGLNFHNFHHCSYCRKSASFFSRKYWKFLNSWILKTQGPFKLQIPNQIPIISTIFDNNFERARGEMN